MPKNPPQKPIQKGRPKNSGLRVPHWAHQAIAALSSRSGVSSQKILETALRDGIQLVGEPLGAWVKYQKTAEEQWNEHFENFTKGGPEKREIPEASPFATEIDGGGEEPAGDAPDPERLDLSDFERGHESEVSAINQARNGE